MKIRNGFVSNSSSSSFSIFGVEVDYDCLKNTLAKYLKEQEPIPGCSHKFDRDKNEFCGKCGQSAWHEIDEETDQYEQIEEKLGDMGFTMQSDPDNECYYVGIDLSDMEGNMDKKLDKIKKANKELRKLFGSDGDFLSGEIYE